VRLSPLERALRILWVASALFAVIILAELLTGAV
jgi:hypothetical protein